MSRASNGRGSVCRTKEGWQGWVSCGYDPKTGNRRRKKVRGRTKSEVQAKVDHLLSLSRQARRRVDARMTFSAYLDAHVEDLEGMRSPNTISGYRTDLKYVERSGVGAVRMIDLDEIDIKDLYKWTAQGRSRGSVAHLKRTMSPAIKKAIKQGYLLCNPLEDVEFPGAVSEMPEPFDLDEIDLLVRTVRDRRNGVRWELALLGLRRSEVLGLRWQDINFNTGVMKIRHSLRWSDWEHGCRSDDEGPTCGRQARWCPWRSGGDAEFGPLKTKASKRDITLPEPLLAQLRAQRRAQAAERAAAGEAWVVSDCVIASPDGSPVRFWSDRRDWLQVWRSAGVRQIRIHDLRHTAATALLEMGEDARSLMPMFGWASMKEVERYAHVTPVVRRRVADTQARLFAGGKRDDDTYNDTAE